MKAQILHTATELFLHQGYKSITMDDIAAELGISKKTIYSHFKTKEAIVEASVADLFENICGGIDGICAKQANPIVELYDIKRYVLEHLKGERSSPMYQLQKYYPQIHQELRSKQYGYMQLRVVDNLQRGISEGLFIEDIDVNFVSRIYFIGMTGIKDESIFPKNEFAPNELYEQYLEYHIRGIVTPKGRKLLNQLIQSNHD